MQPGAEELLPYRVGGLMYTPAITKGVAEKLRTKSYPCLMTMALCLEDSIADDALEEAERQLKATLTEIAQTVAEEDRPLLFARIRTPEHMARVHALLGDVRGVLTGYILPKFDLSNADDYIQVLRRINEGGERPWYIMPTLESGAVADTVTRAAALMQIREKIDSVRPWVLNVRVGGNDFSNLFGLRRSVRQTIYDIGVIRDVLVDILNVFSRDYVVSGPVWEYFGTDADGDWARGLRREIEMDLINGFIGKTAIHPTQLPVIHEALKVTRADFDDAQAILGWSRVGFAVAKSADGSRMNEVKCHTRWARRIDCRGRIYGIVEE